MRILALILAVLPIYFDVLDAKCDCPYKYKRVGCFKDKRGAEALPEMLANERDKHSKYYNGHDIDWFDWENYLAQLTCRCAKEALEKGYKYFGLQYWGECWSGPSPAADLEFDKYDTGDDCYGPEFKRCHDYDVNCVGDSGHNFVYEIETYECDVHFEKIGCYKDGSPTARVGNKLVLTARENNDRFFGQYIDWFNYDIFLPKFACECAKRVVEAGYDTFGMQFYGECWTGENFDAKYYIAQGESSNCINPCYKQCQLWDPFCIGEGHTNNIYRITHPHCEMKYKSLGCYTAAIENDNNPVMPRPELLFNEISPTFGKFNGHMLKFDETWQTKYPQLLCRCARAAKEKGYEHFAIRNRGECWSGARFGQTYDHYGESNECIRKESDPCQDNVMCAGGLDSMNVYEILGTTIQIGK